MKKLSYFALAATAILCACDPIEEDGSFDPVKVSADVMNANDFITFTQKDANGNPVYYWDIVDRIFDTYLERGKNCIMFKPRLDTRDGERTVSSRSGLSAECYFIEEIDYLRIIEFLQQGLQEFRLRLTRTSTPLQKRKNPAVQHRGECNHLYAAHQRFR